MNEPDVNSPEFKKFLIQTAHKNLAMFILNAETPYITVTAIDKNVKLKTLNNLINAFLLEEDYRMCAQLQKLKTRIENE